MVFAEFRIYGGGYMSVIIEFKKIQRKKFVWLFESLGGAWSHCHQDS